MPKGKQDAYLEALQINRKTNSMIQYSETISRIEEKASENFTSALRDKDCNSGSIPDEDLHISGRMIKSDEDCNSGNFNKDSGLEFAKETKNLLEDSN